MTSLLRIVLSGVLIGASTLLPGASAVANEDRLGDPLPERATARLGTLRLRYGSIGDLAYLPDGRVMIALGSTVEEARRNAAAVKGRDAGIRP